MERAEPWSVPARGQQRVPVLRAYHDGVTVILALAGRLRPAAWDAPTPCPEWRAAELAGHLRCMADDYHEYLDDAPASRYARLMATGAHPETLARKLARQNAAELAALPEAPPADHIAAFARSAAAYARRLTAVWELPHHQYRGTVVTVAGMAGAACAEWHLHAWDLATAAGIHYRPVDPEVILAGWQAGQPQLPIDAAEADPAGRLAAAADPWLALLRAAGRSPGWTPASAAARS